MSDQTPNARKSPSWDPEPAIRRFKEDAGTAAAAAQEAVTDKVDDTKEKVAEEIKAGGEAASEAANRLRGSAIPERTFDRLAGQLHQASHALHSKSVDELAVEVREFGRKNPALFLGAAALVGFAAARFARASNDDPDIYAGHNLPRKTTP